MRAQRRRWTDADGGERVGEEDPRLWSGGGVRVVAVKVDPDVAAWVGSGVAIVGGFILNRALPMVFPTTRKVIDAKPPLMR